MQRNGIITASLRPLIFVLTGHGQTIPAARLSFGAPFKPELESPSPTFPAHTHTHTHTILVRPELNTFSTVL